MNAYEETEKLLADIEYLERMVEECRNALSLLIVRAENPGFSGPLKGVSANLRIAGQEVGKSSMPFNAAILSAKRILALFITASKPR
jgi:hypothetical protein